MYVILKLRQLILLGQSLLIYLVFIHKGECIYFEVLRKTDRWRYVVQNAIVWL